MDQYCETNTAPDVHFKQKSSSLFTILEMLLPDFPAKCSVRRSFQQRRTIPYTLIYYSFSSVYSVVYMLNLYVNLAYGHCPRIGPHRNKLQKYSRPLASIPISLMFFCMNLKQHAVKYFSLISAVKLYYVYFFGSYPFKRQIKCFAVS